MPDYRKSIVKVYCNQKKYKEKFPWMSPEVEKCTGSGFIIHGNKIITNAHVVAGNSFIEVRLASRARRYIARALYIGHDCDLAMLAVDEPSFWHDVAPLYIGNMVEANQQVNVYGFPFGGTELSITQGVVSRIDVTYYSHGNNELLDIQVDAAINCGNSGGPAVSDRCVIGVAHQGIDEGQNIGYIIPVNILKQFLENCLTGIYRGIPSISLETQNLENDLARNYLGLTQEQTGVRISQIDFHSDVKGVFQVGDILLEVDGYKISCDGSIELMGDIRCNFKQAIKLKNIGDYIDVVFIRKGVLQNTRLSLTRKDGTTDLVPYSYFGNQPSYFILSGIVFQCLTMGYIQETNKPLNDLFKFVENGKMDINRNEVVFINDILQCTDTAGYDNVANAVVVKVNAIKVKNMAVLH